MNEIPESMIQSSYLGCLGSSFSESSEQSQHLPPINPHCFLTVININSTHKILITTTLQGTYYQDAHFQGVEMKALRRLSNLSKVIQLVSDGGRRNKVYGQPSFLLQKLNPRADTRILGTQQGASWSIPKGSYWSKAQDLEGTLLPPGEAGRVLVPWYEPAPHFVLLLSLSRGSS